MSGYQTNDVDTFSPLGRLSVRLSHPCKARQVKAAVGEKLGLTVASLPLFGLFQGPLRAPCSVYGDDSIVPPDATLCLLRWNVDLDQESKLSRQDDVAIHLLFAEAQFSVDKGKLQPSPEQTLTLESLADPSFPAERQYLELARTLPGYQSHTARGVVVQGDIISNDVHIPDGTTVTCQLEQDQLVLTGEGKHMSWQWSLVKRWRTVSREQLHYEVCMMQANAPILSWIQLCTHQAYYLRAASELICHRLCKQQQATPPQANPKMAGKPFNPLADFLNTEIFRVKTFTSVEKQ